MQPTFGQILIVALDYLGDERGSVFKTPYLLRWARRSYDEMGSVFKTFQLQDVNVISPAIPVTAGAIEVDPANTFGLENFGDPILIEERPTGSTADYTEVQRVEILPQRDPSDKILEYTLRAGKIQFIASTADIDLRVHYYASGNAEGFLDTATIAVDDCMNFMAAATAAKAGPGKGYTVEAEEAKTAAYGQGNRNPLAILGGYLQALVEPKLRIQQQIPIVPAMYRAGQYRRYR